MPLDTNGNFWAVRPDDGQSRSHVPPQPLWVFFIRIAQFLLAIIIVGLTGYSADTFNAKFLEYGLGSNGITFSFFVFAWTLIFLGWLVASILLFPTVYNYWVHLAAESLVVIFWLACWAVLASNATKLGKYLDAISDRPKYYYETSVDKAIKQITNPVRVAAALGALEWTLFVVTLVFFVMSLLQHRKTEAGQSPVTEPKPEPATEMAPAQQQPYPPQGQQYQQPYPQQPYPAQQQVYPQQN